MVLANTKHTNGLNKITKKQNLNHSRNLAATHMYVLIIVHNRVLIICLIFNHHCSCAVLEGRERFTWKTDDKLK